MARRPSWRQRSEGIVGARGVWWACGESSVSSANVQREAERGGRGSRAGLTGLKARPYVAIQPTLLLV